jgi:hypothetical protein
MKVSAVVALLVGSAEAVSINQQGPVSNSNLAQATNSVEWTYPFGQNTYNDIRAQELKCIADRNREWHYDASTNTGACKLKSYSPYKPYEPENDIRAQKKATNGTFVQTASGIEWTYPFGQNTYNDIRSQELKCIADRNREWHYDASTNTGSCKLKSYSPYKPYEPENDIRAQKAVLENMFA